MTSIIDQQLQVMDLDEIEPAPSLVDVIKAIEEQAAYLATQHSKLHIALLAELIEGLAQAVRKLAEQQEQGWEPVMEVKR